MKIMLDTERCTGLGICESLAPDYFEIADDGSLQLLRTDLLDCDLKTVQKAVDECPTGALRIVP